MYSTATSSRNRGEWNRLAGGRRTTKRHTQTYHETESSAKHAESAAFASVEPVAQHPEPARHRVKHHSAHHPETSTRLPPPTRTTRNLPRTRNLEHSTLSFFPLATVSLTLSVSCMGRTFDTPFMRPHSPLRPHNFFFLAFLSLRSIAGKRSASILISTHTVYATYEI